MSGRRRIEAPAARFLGVKPATHVCRKEAAAPIVDGTEQPVGRPWCQRWRRHSGKRKRHPIKAEIAVAGLGRIVGVSRPAPGRVHDLDIRRLSLLLLQQVYHRFFKK